MKNLFGYILLMLLGTFSMVSCDDFDIENGEYDEDKQEVPEKKLNLPYIDPSWNLELIANIGSQADSVFVYKDKKYDGLFTRTRGWNGGDGVFTTALPDGNVMWSFNDSFYGVVNGDTRARGNSSFPRNSLMIQKARDGKLGETAADFVWLADYVNWTEPTADKYFHCRTHIRHPKGEMSDAQIEAGEIDQKYCYWAGDATVVDGKLQMIWFGTNPKNFKTLGTALATYNLDGTMPDGYYLSDIPDYLPQAGDYMERTNVIHDKNKNAVSFGSTLWEDEDGHTYLYGTNGNDVLVVRTETHDLYGSWEYYVRDATTGEFVWQPTYPKSAEMARSVIMANGYQCNMPWVFKEGDYYYMTAQAPMFSTSVYIYRSKTPYGPFTDQRLLFNLPTRLDKLGNKTYNHIYMVNLHQALSRNGELVFSTNTDAANFWDNFNIEGSADTYRPYFYRVFNWKSVYDDKVR